jgi:hypothetical protein
MKNRALLPVLFLLLSGLCIYYAAGTGGSPDDPLISLSYLNGTFSDTVQQQINALRTGTSVSVAANADVWTETRLKSGDVLSGSTGTCILPLAGGMTVSFSAGAVVDTTSGSEVSSGSALSARHRYLVAEDTAANFTASGKTAVLDYQGPYSLSYSDSTDYNALAEALKTIHLFRGSLTGYGSGFDLEVSPTRLQALIMFVRLLGEEDEALAYAGAATPFTDIQAGSDPARYVGYAYSKGYTNGYTKTTFRPSQKVNAYQYVEFVLRALGYSSTGTTDLTGTLDRAVSCGVLNAGEETMLARDVFLRADLVYVSWYALDAQVSGAGQTLRQTLLSKGIFTENENFSASGLISGSRIS